MNLNNIILKPIITEKAYALQESSRYSFKVDRKATKNQIAHAFEEIFKIKPLCVNTSITRGQTKTNWKDRKSFLQPSEKRAIITIPKDKKLEILNIKTK